MRCEIHPLGSLGRYKYVVVLSVYQGRLLLSRHRARDTWETQGGHVEAGETPLMAARRELFEESGAAQADITPLFDYCAADDTSQANGQVFRADIRRLEALPSSEMAEVRLFDALPARLTYPDLTPLFFARAGLTDVKRQG